MNDISVVILSGGKSSRMGSDKATLMLDGKTFAEILKDSFEENGTECLKDSKYKEKKRKDNFAGETDRQKSSPAADAGRVRCAQILLSVRDEKDFPGIELPHIADQYPGCGPLAGIQSALKYALYDWVFVVACDTPFVTLRTIEELYECLADGGWPVGKTVVECQFDGGWPDEKPAVECLPGEDQLDGKPAVECLPDEKPAVECLPDEDQLDGKPAVECLADRGRSDGKPAVECLADGGRSDGKPAVECLPDEKPAGECLPDGDRSDDNDDKTADTRQYDGSISDVCGAVDAVIPLAPDGRVHVLCALYNKRILTVIERQLGAGNYRVREALKDIRVKYVPVSHFTDYDRVFLNINTPQAYQEILNQQLHGGKPEF